MLGARKRLWTCERRDRTWSRWAWRLAGSALCPLLLSACGGGVAPPAPPLIAPGVSAGALQIGRPFSEARAAYEMPSIRADADSWQMWAEWPTQGLTGVYSDNDKDEVLDDTETCKRIFCVSPFKGRTAAGIGLGSSRDLVRQALGYPDATDQVAGTPLDVYVEGIMFGYDSNASASLIVVSPSLRSPRLPSEDARRALERWLTAKRQ